jgi:hypothetical protein
MFEIGDRVRVPDSRNSNGTPAVEATVTRVIRSGNTELIAYITDDGDARWTYTSRAVLVQRAESSPELDAKLVAAHAELMRIATRHGVVGEATSATQRRVVDGVPVIATWTRGLDPEDF